MQSTSLILIQYEKECPHFYYLPVLQKYYVNNILVPNTFLEVAN